MPIREYICSTCHPDKVIDLLVGMNEVPKCDSCKEELKQVINEGPAGFVKGSPFYCAKDYK